MDSIGDIEYEWVGCFYMAIIYCTLRLAENTALIYPEATE